ncbi:hypothetical protein Tco_0820832 [Tanacetum coccineum]|uniref:Transposase (Putative), gypsy type n=1 Tax=Tanacetum coccineum TaxID=301880 RepID=A0ABQ5ABG7_9ASTR
MGPRVNKRRRKRGSDEVDANVPPKVLRKDHAVVRPEQNSCRYYEYEPPRSAVLCETTTAHRVRHCQVFRDPHQKYGHRGGARPVLCGESGVREIDLRPVRGWVARRYLPARVGRDQQLPPGYPERMPRRGGSHSAAGVRLLKKARAKIARRDKRIQVREEEIKKLDQEVKSIRTVETEVHGLRNQAKNLETLLEAEVDMNKAAEAKNGELAKELESLRVQFTGLQVSNNQLSQQVSTLQDQVTGEERIKAAFEEFKKYEDDRVNSRCAKIDARLDAMSIDFNEELYPHMLTAIAGRQWVIGHGLHLAAMKCDESTELRQVFADVVSPRIAKGMSEGLKHGIEHGKAKLDLADIEAYDPKADTKYVAALHALKNLKYPLVDQLENSSQLKIPVYPEVRDPKYPWSFKEEILLEDAIAANISRVEKKKKCRVVCRTHGVSSAHHARSDGIPVSVPIVAPQGLAILLADAATLTEISKDEASPRLLISKSLQPMYNLDWP